MTTSYRRAEWRESVTPNRNSTRVPQGAQRRTKQRYTRVCKGQPTSVPARIVRDHVLWLRSVGFGDPAIAAAAGVSHHTVYHARTKTRSLSHFEVAVKILSVQHIPVPAQAGLWVPKTGTSRRLRALSALGWTDVELGRRLDVSGKQVADYASTSTPRTLYETWRAVADLYEELSGRPGPNNQARRRAHEKGYVSSIGWEGVDIDHPDSVPVVDAAPCADAIDEVLLQRMIAGRHQGDVRGPERKAVIDHAIEHGWGHERLARSLNVSLAGADMALVRRRRELREAA